MTRTKLATILISACLTMGQLWRDHASSKNEQGNRLYEQQDYDGALQAYVEAQVDRRHQQVLSYNLANALYRMKKYPEAIKELDKVVSLNDSKLKQQAYYNLGNGFFQTGQFQQAVEAYVKALELNPDDQEAKYNLELALKKLQENPKQKEQSSRKDPQSDPQESRDQGNKRSPESDKAKTEEKKSEQESKPSPDQSSRASQESTSAPQQQPSQPEPKDSPRAKGMDPSQAMRILDALNDQEKSELRKQALKVQRERKTEKDW
ncbi:MAG: tetratricopeptide repeat protein [Acidobacteriota bacterium]